jgi:hypothetical protein
VPQVSMNGLACDKAIKYKIILACTICFFKVRFWAVLATLLRWLGLVWQVKFRAAIFYPAKASKGT